MKNTTKAVAVSKSIARSVVEETPANALRFFVGVNKPEIRQQLQAAGYTDADHAEGWKFFLRVTQTETEPAPASPENESAKAFAEIQSWVGQAFERARAVWERKFPEVEAYVFQDIDGSKGGAVYDLATFLDRVGELQNGSARKATRKSDHAALEALAQRGIGSDVLESMKSLLKTAQASTTVTPIAAPVDDRTETITDLYMWLRDWRKTARAVIKNRSQLISLGIGKRHSKKSDATPAPSPVTITPVASSPAPLQLVSGSKST